MYQRFAILLSAGALAVTVACSQTDAGITSSVKSKMAADNTVKASEINVDTHNHVVTLNGTVGSQAERERAVMIARNTKGVNSVIDDLKVGPRRGCGQDHGMNRPDLAAQLQIVDELAARDSCRRQRRGPGGAQPHHPGG